MFASSWLLWLSNYLNAKYLKKKSSTNKKQKRLTKKVLEIEHSLNAHYKEEALSICYGT